MQKKQTASYHHGDLRNTLIAAAVQLLAENGLTALSLREVAKTAGVSNAAPYRHFRDKAALIEALATEGFLRLRKSCEAAQKKYSDDPARQLTEAGMAYLLFSIEQPTIIHLMFGGIISLNDCGEEVKKTADDAFGSLLNIVSSGQQANIYSNSDTYELTLTAWSTVYGLSLMVSSGLLSDRYSSKVQIRKLGESIAKILLSGMLKR
jgi:AcrR family transcriptional regulator